MGTITNVSASVTTQKSIRRFEGRTVSKIKISGLKRIESDAVQAKLITQKGKPLRQKNIRKEISAIFSMGYFDDLEVSALASGKKQVQLTYKMKERSVISEILFEGNERIDTDDLKEVVESKAWSILDINRIREDTEKIRKHYEEKGFYLTKVQYELEPEKSSKDQVKLIFRVKDYDKVQVKKIIFLNNKVFDDDQLKKIFQETKEGSFFSFLDGSGSFKDTAFKQDLQRLTFWYLDHGYVKFRFENPVITVSDDKRWMYITIYVDEGLEYKMGELDFGGDLLFEKEDLSKSIKLKKDDIFKISTRNFDIRNLTEKYQDLGYAFVNVIPKMNIKDDKKEIDIEYVFEKGNLVYFGEVRVLGNSKTYDKVIRRELRIYEGELYSGTQLRKSRERVERLGYFEPGQVIFNTLTRKGRDDVVDLEIKVKERSTGTITLGAGYGSVQNFFFTAQISEINLFGRGQTLSFQAQYSADRKQRSFNLGFTDPYAFDTKWSVGGDIFSLTYLIPNKYSVRKLGFDIRLGYPITDDISAFITYKNEGLQINDKIDPAEDTSLDEGVLSSVIWSLVRDRRNNRFETSKGNYQKFALETAGLGGDKKFIKLNLNNRYYSPLVGDLVFRSSVEYGHIFDTSSRGTPSSERFYLGGPNNMRGFSTFLLGPIRFNSAGNAVPAGGMVQLYGLLELEYPLIREMGLKWVVFYDVGNAWSTFPGTNGQAFDLRMDYGFGFRWFSPLGPLRFEWGFPVDKRPWEDDVSFWFFIGQPF